MPHSRALAFLSLLVHAAVIGTIVVAQIFAVGTLPLPRRPVTFEHPRVVSIGEVTPPAQVGHPRTAAAGTAPSVSHAVPTPTEAPVGITPETGLNRIAFSTAIGDIEREGAGAGGIESIGRVQGVPPRPPAPVPVRLHVGMRPPRKIVDVAPVYPAIARAARVAGIVILEAVIDARGQVESVRVLRSIPTLDQAAVDAVRQWRFTPTLLNGEPVPIVMTVTVNFTLSP
jgi:periplasmic protein TonB